MLHGHTLRPFRFEKERARQFALADLIAVPSPPAVARYRQLARHYGGPSLEEKVRLIPHPVAPWFTWSGASKESRVAVVGRWDDLHQKRPDLLAAALREFLTAHPAWQADIFGAPGPLLEQWRASLPAGLSTRVIFHGRVASHDLAHHLDRAKILFCPSAFESFHIASGEALCAGASVVATDSGMTATHRWFVSAASGTLAPCLDAHHLASALTAEATAWDAGQRDPASISATWCSRLHAPRVAEMLIHGLS
jgi:glycosyltransferase involved in cell wall biosynthesis